MNFPTIRIEGSILSPDILDKIEQGDIGGQSPKDFGFDSKIKVKDEIAKAWADANSQWKIFKNRIETVKENESGNSETRRYLIIPLLGFLGYEVEFSKSSEVINGKSYAISHKAANLDNFPIHVMGFKDSLDKRRIDSGPRMSPHSLIQEYINLTVHLFAIVTNGFLLRLLRDSSRLVKLSYIEFDLEKMFEDEQYTDFALLFRLLHSSRMPFKKEQGPESIIERYHQDALDSGARIRDGLCNAVENSIKILGNGFLNNKNNSSLRSAFDNKTLDWNNYHLSILRLIYRLLFLMVIEERGLVYPDKSDSNHKKIYYDYYSISSLRKFCEKRFLLNKRYNNYWIHLKNCFRIFENEMYGKPLGIKPLAGELFERDAIGILNECDINNSIILQCFKNLSFYESEVANQTFRVNYAALSVEEFGSVYEGLLEFKPHIQRLNGKYVYSLVKGSERSISGSHYTPDELVQPLIKHSLDYIIEDKLKEKDKEKALLSITVCDVACGSGHILLNAARRIAIELAKVRSGEDQPSPQNFRVAIKDVIKHCIYGVDKNPLAVELCKVALWLESHNPGEPLNFLDHKIKCGDSIVGLAHKEELLNGIPTEAFNRMPEDDKDICSEFKKMNKSEVETREKKKQIPLGFKNSVDLEIKDVSSKILDFSNLPETTTEEVEFKKQKYLEINSGNDWWRLKNLADIQVAQFFIPKTEENKYKLRTDKQYYELLPKKQILGDFLYKAQDISQDMKFFHWFLEFPEIFNNGGFECILGNPPFLGDRRLKEAFGEYFLEWIRYNYSDGATVDLVVYFFLRINSIINSRGFQSLISTNTISQGKAREFGLEKIIETGSVLNHAVKSMKWPGLAAVEVSLVTIYKGEWLGKFYLNGKETNQISPFLDEADNTGTPFPLFSNEGKSYQGSIILGMGFILYPSEAKKLIDYDSKNQDVIFPYLNGDDLNSNPNQNPSRFVINFFDLPEEKAVQYKEVYKVIEKKVKPERIRWKEDKDGNPIIGEYALRHPLPEKWWQHCEKRPALYNATKQVNRVLVSCRVSKYVNQSFVDVGAIFDVATSVVIRSEFWEYAFLQSTIHEYWAWKYASTLESRIRYVNVDCIDTFPILDNLPKKLQNTLESIGEQYHEYRKQLMQEIHLGLTKTYNLFHSKGLSDENIDEKDKQIQSLQKHLNTTPNTIPFKDAIDRILKLRELHKQLNEAVLEAYGWTNIELRHDFYEVDFLPENDRIRYTINPDAQKEILKRLLELNHKIHEEEVTAGLWDKKKTKKSKPSPDCISDRTGELFE